MKTPRSVPTRDAWPSRVLHYLAWAAGSSTRRARRQGTMRILMLHGVGDAWLRAETFDRLVRYLTRNFDVLPLAEIVQRRASRLRITGREVALTFDDGLRNNVTVAWPTLREYGAPGTFFVCPTLIDNRTWLWNHEVRARLERLDDVKRMLVRQGLSLPHVAPQIDDVGVLVEAMKRLDRGARARAETVIREATPTFEPTPEERRRYDVMGWDDLATVDFSLITVGSHTNTHPILPTLDDASLESEIAGSRSTLETFLGRPVEFFCYPNGAEDERVRRVVREHYGAAVTTEPGVVGPGADPYRLERIGVSPSRSTLAWRLNRP